MGSQMGVASINAVKSNARLVNRPMRHWIKQADGTEIHVTKKNENDAMEFLRTRPKEKPFVLTLAFIATHAEDQNPKQYLPQPESMALYKDVTVPVPKTATDAHFRRLPPFIANDKNEQRELDLLVTEALRAQGIAVED